MCTYSKLNSVDHPVSLIITESMLFTTGVFSIAACHVDDTALSEVLRVDQPSRMQENLDDIVSQSAASLMNINVKKTKEMRLGACARKQQYQDLILEGNIIENVKNRTNCSECMSQRR